MDGARGGYCETRITDLIQKEIGISEDQIRYSRKNSCMFTGKVRMKNETGRRSDHRGGPAGLAAVEFFHKGITDILILKREKAVWADSEAVHS